MTIQQLLILLFIGHLSMAQTTVSFDATNWRFDGNVIPDTFQGKAGIKLTRGQICLKDTTFINGIFEFDMALSPERNFVGFSFRTQDKDNFEYVYLRPHRVGNPDAIQYIPVNNGLDAWQFYYGDGYSTTVTYPLTEWVHIKCIVRDTQAEVYVGDPARPALVIHQLKRAPRTGPICLINDSPVIARFANFSYTKTDTPPVVGPFKPEAPTTPGTLLNWQVSTTFDEKEIQTGYTLPKALANALTWSPLFAESSGVLNVARIRKWQQVNNTVFVKLTLLSDKPQIKKLDLGFSDRVRVYLNSKLMYMGSDEFLSRDYRFLGTVGYYDAIYLDLKKGRNELWMAVSESFGGWGIKGLIADQRGLKLIP